MGNDCVSEGSKGDDERGEELALKDGRVDATTALLLTAGCDIQNTSLKYKYAGQCDMKDVVPSD